MEMLIAVGVLGLIRVVFVTALGSSSRSTGILHEQVVAGELAQAQMAQIQKAAFNADVLCYPNNCYPPTVTPPTQYTVTVTTSALDDPGCLDEGSCNTLQKVTVLVSRPDGAVFSLTTYKRP